MSPFARVLAAVAFLILPVAVMAPMQLSVLLAVTGAAGAVLCGVRASFAWRPLALLFVLSALSLASLAWTIAPGLTLLESARFLATLAAGAFVLGAAARLSPSDAAKVERWFLGGAALGAGLLGFEIATEGALLKNARTLILGEERFVFSVAYNRATSVIALAVWPATLALWRTRARWTAPLALAVAAVLVAALQKHASLIALAAGAGVACLALVNGRWVARALAAATVAAMLLWPLAPLTFAAPAAVVAAFPSISFSEYHRVLIWRFTAERIAERPLLGWGFNTARAIPGGKDKVPTAIPERGASAERDPEVERLPLHPHSAPLQLWLELGLPGALLGAAFGARLLARIGRESASRAIRAAMLAAATSAGAIFAMSFSIWQSWWLATLFLVSGLLAAMGRARDDG